MGLRMLRRLRHDEDPRRGRDDADARRAAVQGGGYLFAAIAFFIVTPIAGWRGLFFVGAVNLPLQTSLADAHSPSFALLVVIVAVITLTALGAEAHSAGFGREERERFVSDRFTREPRPAVRRSARA